MKQIFESVDAEDSDAEGSGDKKKKKNKKSKKRKSSSGSESPSGSKASSSSESLAHFSFRIWGSVLALHSCNPRHYMLHSYMPLVETTAVQPIDVMLSFGICFSENQVRSEYRTYSLTSMLGNLQSLCVSKNTYTPSLRVPLNRSDSEPGQEERQERQKRKKRQERQRR